LSSFKVYNTAQVPRYGCFSWDRIELTFKTENNTFNFYGNNDVEEISTSALIQRRNILKYKNYVV